MNNQESFNSEQNSIDTNNFEQTSETIENIDKQENIEVFSKDTEVVEKTLIETLEDIEKESNEINFMDENTNFPDNDILEQNLSKMSDQEDEELNLIVQAKEQLTEEVNQLKTEKEALQLEIETLKKEKDQLLDSNTIKVKEKLDQIITLSLEDLQQRKQELQIAVEKLERRRERVREEMRTTFAGVSQDLAVRIQGFKEYLVGSLQDLTAAAEQLELPSNEQWEIPVNKQSNIKPAPSNPQPQFSEQNFAQEKRKVKETLEQYRTRPDYYGAPWQLRRTFEPIHAERVQNWFFSQGGRGAIKSMGSRLQNILVASAVMSVLHKLYGNRLRSLILANTPERLGEWRRGLQDCLGISRSDFGPERGVVLFEQPEALIQKAERLREEKLLPLVIIDETEDNINLSLLQFPLWLAFAPEAQPSSNYFY
jgi:hypothetical protein